MTLGVEATPPVVVEADSDRLRQVVGNLVSNALRATPDAYLLTQRKYGHGWHNPVATAGHILTRGRLHTYGTATPLVTASLNAPRVQFVVVAVIVATAVAATTARLARATYAAREATDDLALLISTIVLGLVPVVVGPNVATYRSHALLLPSVVLLRDLPRWILGALLAACAAASAMLGAVYYHGILV